MIVVPIVSLPLLNNDMDDGEPHHSFHMATHVATCMILVLANFDFNP